LLDKFRAEIDKNPMAPASTSAEQNVTNDESEGSIDSEEFEAYEAAHETESESSDEDDFEGSYSRDMDQIDHQGNFYLCNQIFINKLG